MQIDQVVDILNKKLGSNIKTTYYTYIAEWLQWWKGYYKPFHQFAERSGPKIIKRDLYSLRMAKKVCEDWASILLNEKTQITTDDDKTTKYLIGKNGTSGILGDNKFWLRGNRLIERAFATGTGAIVTKISNMLQVGDTVKADANSTIRFECIDATGIIPISVEDGYITELALVDELKGVDLAYNNFNRDFKLGGKKVFIDSSLTQYDENGNIVTPDDVAQQLFMVTDGDMSENGKALIHEYNPALRVTENKEGVQSQLDYLSFKCGLGTKHYQFNGGSVVTATQYTGDKQELIQNAAKHYIIVEQALVNLVKFILWAAKNICAADVNPDANITVSFEDSYIIDKESERLRDLQEVRDGIKQKWEYRMKWYGESEEDAKKALSNEKEIDFGFGDE